MSIPLDATPRECMNANDTSVLYGARRDEMVEIILSVMDKEPKKEWRGSSGHEDKVIVVGTKRGRFDSITHHELRRSKRQRANEIDME